jgi:hypothetical protein
LTPEAAERAAGVLDLALARSRAPSFERFARTLEGLAKQYLRAPAA